MEEKDTNALFEEVAAGGNPKISTIEKQDVKNEIAVRIQESRYKSQAAVSRQCHIKGSALNQYLNGVKELPRDKVLAVLIALKYTPKEINQRLSRLDLKPLYVKNKRDRIIIEGVRDGMNMDDLDEKLIKQNLEGLYPWPMD